MFSWIWCTALGIEDITIIIIIITIITIIKSNEYVPLPLFQDAVAAIRPAEDPDKADRLALELTNNLEEMRGRELCCFLNSQVPSGLVAGRVTYS
jgi:hypothetical protein